MENYEILSLAMVIIFIIMVMKYIHKDTRMSSRLNKF